MSCARGCCASQAEHFRSIALQMRTRETTHHRDFQIDADRDAYKALRSQGLQPRQMQGSYDLQRRATSQAEIEMGAVIADKDPALKRRGARTMENILEVSNEMRSWQPEELERIRPKEKP